MGLSRDTASPAPPPATIQQVAAELTRLPGRRRERLVAWARLTLTLAAGAAVVLTSPRGVQAAAFPWLGAWTLLALAAVAAGAREAAPRPRLLAAFHAADVLLVTLLVFATGPGTPWAHLFLFPLLVATVRGDRRLVVASGGVAVAVVAAAGLWFGLHQPHPAFDAGRTLVRLILLVLATVFLRWLAAQIEENQRERAQLAALASADPTQGLRELLAQAKEALQADWVALRWEAGDAVAGAVGPAGELVPLTAPSADDAAPAGAWMALPSRRGGWALWRTDGKRPDLLAGAPGPPDPSPGPARALVSVPLAGEAGRGRLWVIDPPRAGFDLLFFAAVVGKLLALRLDAGERARQLQASVTLEERLRLSRDLHDGVLQSLAGVSLGLASVGTAIERGGPAGKRLEEVQRLVSGEQQSLRRWLGELDPARAPPVAPRPPLPQRLAELADRCRAEWEVAVAIELPAGGLTLAPGLEREIYHLAREAVVNAVRHGNARSVRVAITERPDILLVVVEDDGAGFPFTGRREGSELLADGLAPRSVQERLTALGGSLAVASGPAGARLEMTLPGSPR